MPLRIAVTATGWRGFGLDRGMDGEELERLVGRWLRDWAGVHPVSLREPALEGSLRDGAIWLAPASWTTADVETSSAGAQAEAGQWCPPGGSGPDHDGRGK